MVRSISCEGGTIIRLTAGQPGNSGQFAAPATSSDDEQEMVPSTTEDRRMGTLMGDLPITRAAKTERDRNLYSASVRCTHAEPAVADLLVVNHRIVDLRGQAQR